MANIKYSIAFPFIFQGLSNVTNPGWVDTDDAYPLDLTAPAADQPQVRVVGTTDAGEFMLGVSTTYAITSANNSAQGRFSLDGGATWEDFSKESKDSTDLQALTYQFPFVWPGGAYDFVFQMKKENTTNNMDVHFMNLWFDKRAD
jgi:hypothetical protein